MHGIGFDLPLQEWFDFKIPRTLVPSTYIHRALNNTQTTELKPSTKLFWIGPKPTYTKFTSNKKGKAVTKINMQFSTLQNDFAVSFNEKQGTIIQKWLEQLTAYKKVNVAQLEAELNENNLGTLQNFIANQNFATLQDIGLLIL